MTRGLILHTMPDDVRAILVALAEAADVANAFRGYPKFPPASCVTVDMEIAESAREILSREHKG